MCGYFHIIIAIDAQNIFHYVARTLNIYTISGNFELQTFVGFFNHLHAKARHNALNNIVSNLFANYLSHIGIFQVNVKVGYWFGVNVLYLHRYFATCQFFAKNGGLFQGIHRAARVDATLKAVARIGAKSVAACAFPNPCGVEIGTFQHNIARCFVCSAAFSTKHASDAHRFFCVADAQVRRAKRMFFAI